MGLKIITSQNRKIHGFKLALGMENLRQPKKVVIFRGSHHGENILLGFSIRGK